MTREILYKLAKEHKITLSHYDEIFGFIIPNGKRIIIEFVSNMGAGIYRGRIIEKTITLNVSAVLRNMEKTGIFPEDYTTQGYTRMFDIRWA